MSDQDYVYVLKDNTQTSFSSDVLNPNNQDQSHFQKAYSKRQFVTILKELSEENSLYFCQREELQLIYDKVIQTKTILIGSDLADFAQALKEKNKQNFHQEITLYKEYLAQVQNNKEKVIKSKDFLAYLNKSESIGYLTDRIFELLEKSQQISIKKLYDLIESIDSVFKQNETVSIPKKISLKKSQFYEDQSQYQYEAVQKDRLDIRSIQILKQTVIQYINEPKVAQKVEFQMNRMQNLIAQVNDITIPQLNEQVDNLRKYNKQIQTQLTSLYSQLELKDNEVIQSKNQIMDLVQKVKELNKQLIKTKIQLNMKEETNYEFLTIKNTLESKLEKQREEMQQFINSYSTMRAQYQSYISQIKKKQDQRKTKQQANMFPSLSLKQQIQDANFKIKKLKQEKSKLIVDLQNNQTNFITKIQALQRQLLQAKNNANRTEQFKMTGMSRLSRNFEDLRNSKPYRNSIFQSIVSVFGPSTEQGQKKMSMFIQQVDQYIKESKKESIYTGLNGQLNISKRNSKDKTIKMLQQDINDAFEFEDKLQSSFKRQNKIDQPKYNFCDVNYEELKKRLGLQNKSIMSEQLDQEQELNSQSSKQKIKHLKQQTLFICAADIVSKSGSRYKKYILFNRKGIYLFDSKLRLQKEIFYQKILKITFTYYNLDCFVLSFKRKQSPMKKKVINTQSDIVFKCLKAKQLIAFLSQPIFRNIILKQAKIRVSIQKEENIWIRQSTEKDIVLSNCGNFYNPFKVNLSLKNYHNNTFFSELSRQVLFSLSYIVVCIVQQFGVYCFQWRENQIESERKFIYLLPLVKRMLFIRQEASDTVKLIYEDWSDGKTFLLRFKNSKQSLRFQTVCKDKLKKNLSVLQARKNMIEDLFCPAESNLNLSQQRR